MCNKARKRNINPNRGRIRPEDTYELCFYLDLLRWHTSLCTDYDCDFAFWLGAMIDQLLRLLAFCFELNILVRFIDLDMTP